jgi:hypothetical protein
VASAPTTVAGAAKMVFSVLQAWIHIFNVVF